MFNLHISNSELRLATAALAALSVIVPTVYFIRSEKSQEVTPHLQTFRKLLKAYATLRPAALGANASKEFSHTVLPLSLNLPPRSLENFQQHAAMIFSLFEDFKMEPHGQVHFSKETNTVIAHCKMGGKVNAASEMGKKLIDGGITDWWTECVLFVKMTPDGTKVVELKEFVNSSKAEELQQRLSGVLSK
ncbi:uncharacterized protein CC84DRAFT_1167633 [Paraphaeosphaeria sporulosa]|uniref:SnoaL-like domain-containing protein n=1 Tax=Paraphaeosphaeria sporulosa TaxID=1460663 RepID=A0A177C430_9PLEO|nr:uncharacterized protein CC84DRAFT_1167633 [Paraphaeosphaeria sporulosa]OAG01430.1 hypothetical protein CC84DRAFT_1167633 [Paraphaeosphaeria sporulosa]